MGPYNKNINDKNNISMYFLVLKKLIIQRKNYYYYYLIKWKILKGPM
jgi:hypothetical protein